MARDDPAYQVHVLFHKDLLLTGQDKIVFHGIPFFHLQIFVG